MTLDQLEDTAITAGVAAAQTGRAWWAAWQVMGCLVVQAVGAGLSFTADRSDPRGDAPYSA